MKYIIDTDPGIDDALAIMLGYLNHLDIIGFTLATGNIEKEKSKNNLKVIQKVLNSNIKMYEGTNSNIPNSYAAFAHGEDVLGNTFFPEIDMPFEEISAEDFIISKADELENNLTIICLGPLTNLANALKRRPDIASKIAEVVIMGTSYSTDIANKYEEFNIKIDPLSASLVLSSPFKKIRCVTHEIGVKSYIEINDIEKLTTSNKTVSKFAYMIAQKYIEFTKEHNHIIGLSTPDPTTMASVIDESIVTFKPCNLKINGNYTDITLTEKSNIYVSVDFNLQKFRELFMKTFM